MGSSDLLKEIEKVLRRHNVSEYNSRVVIAILSRSRRAKKGAKLDPPLEKRLKVTIGPADIVAEQRERLKLSLSALSKLTGIEKSNLSAIENGKRAIGIKTAKILAKALQINYKALV